jgi:transmembrane sensor
VNDKRPQNPIDAAAADWVARLDRGVEAPAEREAFERWLAADQRHYGAYVRAQAMWTRLDRGAVLGAGVLARPARRSGLPRRGLLIGGGAAAAAAAAGVAGFVVLDRQVRRYAFDAALGEISQVSLPDGSTATLDTDSRITMALSKESRTVHVERGRVWFKVAKNHDWPFVVESGPTRARAVGTAFAVERTGGGTEVTVTEGVVDAWAANGPPSQRLRLERGGRARLTADRAERLEALAPADLDRTLAWRDGMISLYGETLGEASAAFNRYNRRKIVVEDSQLAARRVVGHFRLQDPQGFAKAAAGLLGARVHDDGDRILLAGGGGRRAR